MHWPSLKSFWLISQFAFLLKFIAITFFVTWTFISTDSNQWGIHTWLNFSSRLCRKNFNVNHSELFTSNEVLWFTGSILLVGIRNYFSHICFQCDSHLSLGAKWHLQIAYLIRRLKGVNFLTMHFDYPGCLHAITPVCLYIRSRNSCGTKPVTR